MGVGGNSVICIIGMHRSGTSMVAQLLHHGGLYLGPEDQLLGRNSGNPDGHFEHTGVLRINDALLRSFHGTWAFPPHLEPGWERETRLEPLRVEARSVLDTLRGNSVPGWKDPRTTILLPFWKSIIPALRFVICVRNPLDVAKSLAMRDKIAIGRGAFLWYHYLRAAIHDTEGCPRIFTFYDDHFANAAVETDRLLRFCALPRQLDPTLLASDVRAELRHHNSKMLDLLEDGSIPAEYKLAYLALRALLNREIASSVPDGSSVQCADQCLRLIDEFLDQDRFMQLEAELTKEKLESAKLRADIRKDLKANHRWAYRVYRNIIRPLRMR